MIKKILIIVYIFLLPFLLKSQDLFLARNLQGLYGFVDKNGDTIIDCKYQYAEPFSNGLALVKNNLRYKIIDTAGNLYDLMQYDGSHIFLHNLGEYNSGLPVIVSQWDCAYITSGGDVFLQIPYQDATSFEGGKAKVFRGNKYNYISRNGILLDTWKKIDDDYHAVKNKDGIFGYIDRYGKLVIDYQFVNAEDFKNGLAKVSNGRFWAVIDKTGKRISDWYDKIEDFSGNLAIVYKMGNIGLINKQGSFKGEWYKSVKPLDFGLYKVEKYGTYAIVNQDGYVVTQWFQQVEDFKDGYLKVKKDEKYAYLNKIAALVIGWYDTITEVKNGIIRIADNKKYAFYNVEKFTLSSFYEYLGDFSDGMAVFKDKNKYGYINKLCKIVIEPQFDLAKPFVNGIAQVEKDDKVAYINTNANVVLGWFDKKNLLLKEAPRGIYAVKYGTKWGFDNINGKRIIPAKYDYAENFVYGLALVKNEPTPMYIDKHGNLLPKVKNPDLSNLYIDLGYGHSGKPIEVIAWKCYFIDYNGDIAISLDEFNDAYSFIGDKAKVIKGDKYTYINRKGKIIDNKWYDVPDNYHADYKNGKFGFIDKKGQQVIPYQFDYAEDFKNNKALVRMGDRNNGKYAFINNKGTYISKFYDAIDTVLRYNTYLVKLQGKYKLIDTAGKEITSWYDEILPFSNGFALVRIANKYSFIDTKGKQFKNVFDYANTFSCQRAKVQINGKFGFIDTKGDIVIAPVYENVTDFSNYIARIEKDGKVALMDINGRIITDWFDRIYFFNDERAVIVQNNKWGYIDINGRLVVRPIYDRAFAYTNGKAIVVKNGKMISIDKDGNEITEN